MHAFDNLYGFPDVYFLVDRLALAIMAPHAKSKVDLSDLVPYFTPPKKPQTTQDHKSMFRSLSKKRV